MPSNSSSQAAATPPSGRGRGRGRGDSPIALAPSGVPFGHVPAYLPGSASLVEELDQKLLLVLRDGRHLVGTLRSFDQFSNLVLEDTSERRMCRVENKTYFADVPLGLYVVRGDSMVLMGALNQQRISPEQEEEEVSLERLEELQNSEATRKDALEWDFDTDLVA